MKLPQFSLKLDARSKFLLLVMTVLLAGVVYYRLMYVPRAGRLREVRERYLALADEVKRLESSIPDAGAEQEKFQTLKKNYDGLLAQVQNKEKVLPKNVNIPDILEFLVQDKDKYNLKIVSISSRKDKIREIPLYKPSAGSKQKPISYYTLLPIEMEAFGSFDDVIAYISNLEKKLPFQRIGRLQIDMRKTAGGQPQCFLTVLSVLGRGQEVDESLKDFQAALAEAENIAIEDPFRKKGVFHAIINGTTYGVGDSIQKKKIIKIDKNGVILEEENKLFKLTLK